VLFSSQAIIIIICVNDISKKLSKKKFYCCPAVLARPDNTCTRNPLRAEPGLFASIEENHYYAGNFYLFCFSIENGLRLETQKERSIKR